MVRQKGQKSRQSAGISQKILAKNQVLESQKSHPLSHGYLKALSKILSSEGPQKTQNLQKNLFSLQILKEKTQKSCHQTAQATEILPVFI